MNQDDGGSPHITIGDPVSPDARVEEVWILVATDPNGGEGIYGHKINDSMFSFVTLHIDMKDALEKFLREKGTIEVCRREGVKLEWRKFNSGREDDVEVIT